MALINCPECGKEISDTCESCIHCGYKLSNNEGSKGKQANKKKIPIIAILLVIVIIIGVGIASILIINSIRENNRIEQEKQEQLQEQEEAERHKQAEIEAHKLTYEEEICYYAIQYFKTILRDPDSLQINDIKIAPTFYVYEDELDIKEYYSEYTVTVDYSAQNGFGGNDRNVYYITMNNHYPSKNNTEPQEIQQRFFSNDWIINVNKDKIKYALDHPEVLDY